MVRCIFTFLLLVVFALPGIGQGKIMLVGGGAEDEEGWSNTPYQWAVDQSLNKKVAVISYQDETEFIPTYFESLGAIEATNFKIDSKVKADLQSTYDELMAYDVFFFKGGDQSFYYNYFKDTKTQLAIIDKFNAGGVISGTSAGMAIISEVIFTAEKDTVYPDEVLEDYTSSNLTLHNDLVNVLPGIIVDSHFTERGRGARLIGFMAKWYDQSNELLTGIGVDDRTSLCITADKIGTVYGTGTVSFYNAPSFSSYQKEKLVVDSLHVTQLLNGHQIDLATLSVLDGPNNIALPSPSQETDNSTLLLSGTNNVNENDYLLNELLNGSGNKLDTIVIVTSNGGGKSYISKLTSLSIPIIVVETTEDNNLVANASLRNQIRRSKKILFVENSWPSLRAFLADGATGQLLNEHIRRQNVVTAFVGNDSRLVGKVFTSNNLQDQYSAYYGKLTYDNGLGLLSTTIVMPDTYNISSSKYYENNTAAISYGLVKHNLAFGIYLNRQGVLKFYQVDGKNYFSARGNLSTPILVNEGTQAELASQIVNNSGATRNYVGFRDMHFSMLNGWSSIEVGIPTDNTDEPYIYEEVVTGIRTNSFGEKQFVYPNPSSNGLFYFNAQSSSHPSHFAALHNIQGELIAQWSDSPASLTLDLTGYPSGVYILFVKSGESMLTYRLIKL